MPSDHAGISPALPPVHTPAEAPASPALQLAQASRALWAATLSLMAAFMQNQAPAHRLQLARRISRNFDTLARQDCFDRACRDTFARLATRWHDRSGRITPEGERSARGLRRLLS